MAAPITRLYAVILPERQSIGDELMSSHTFERAPLSRRRFLKKSVLAAGALAAPAMPLRARAAAPLKPVKMTLDWLYQGLNSGFLVAQEKGFYSEAGLDVAITAGKGSGSTAQLVASKATQIGFSDGFVVGNGVAKGMEIKTVGSIYRRTPSAIMVLADSAINTPKDLAGKTIAMTAGSAQFLQWPAFCKGAGLDPTSVKLVNIDPAGVGPALVVGRVDAIGGYVPSYVPGIEVRANKKVRIFWFADYGVTIVSNGIIVHQDLLKSDPDLLHAFVPPSIKGFLYGRQYMDEMVDIVKKYQPTADPAITRREFELSWSTWVTPHTKGKPLGWGSDTDWTATIQVLHQYGGVTAPLQSSELYTNEFVPTGAEYVPPQEG
jgi:NitT/TauT family transport system substrate-binding protein